MANTPDASQLQSRRSSIDAQRRAMLYWLLVLTAVFTLAFGILNLARGITLLVVLELGVSAFALGLIFIVRHSRNIYPWSLLYLFVLFSMLLGALVTPGVSDKVYVWFFLIPVMAHFLHGRLLGLFLSLTLLSVAWFLYYLHHYDNPELIDIVGFTNVVACSLVLTGGVYACELAREEAEERLHRMASTDALTGLANRKHLREVLDQALERARRTGACFSILEMDLDYFKAINDQYGHDMGDQVLRAVADALNERLRAADTPARWGGEEFLVLLPETDLESARHVAESIRATLGRLDLRAEGDPLTITASIGIAEFPRDGKTLRELILAADNRLYQAKDQGRDRVVT